MGDARNAALLRLQMRAHIHLAGLLNDAATRQLPAIVWTIATTGAITGRVHGLGVTADEQREQFDAWAAHLQVTPRETSHHDGGLSLSAGFAVDGEPVGAIRADIAPPMTDEDGA